MRILFAALSLLVCTAIAHAEAPDISNLPPHPRLWIGGVDSNPGRMDPSGLAERAKTHMAQFALVEQASAIDARALAALVKGDKERIAAIAAELKEATARRGGNLAEIALAFDWIAAELPAKERGIIARHIGDLAVGRRSEAGGRFNPWDNNPLRRDMGIGLAALAIAEDDPRAQGLFDKAHALFEEFIAITGDSVHKSDMYGRGAYGGGWPEGHDYDRHGARYAAIYFLGLRSATGLDVFTGSDFWQAKPLFHIYETLPNGYNVLPFQDNDNPYLHRYDRDVMLVLAKEFEDPHARWYLNHVNTEATRSSGTFEFLFDEPDYPEHDFSDLPKAHYIPGTGLVMARSGWGPNDTYVAFQASDWYVYHQNNAQNVFAIYRNAPLAVKDGVYDGSVHEHYVNYSIRTISYNGITVFDPDEVFRGPDDVPIAANDGGQVINQWRGNPQTLEMWRHQARQTDAPMRDGVDWLDFETNDLYTYAAADAGRAYRPGKVPKFSRQIVFIHPNWIIVFDRVASSDPSFTKKFHLHAPEEMSVTGKTAIITTRQANHTTIPGRLFVKSLLPFNGEVKRIGGIAVYGGNSWVGPEPYNDQLLCPYHLEITAPEEIESYFLTAMYACDADVEEAPEAVIEENTPQRVTISLGGKYTLYFNKTGPVDWGMVE